MARRELQLTCDGFHCHGRYGCSGCIAFGEKRKILLLNGLVNTDGEFASRYTWFFDVVLNDL